MSQKAKSVQAIVEEFRPLAIYVHCSAHVLDLVWVKSRAKLENHSTFEFVKDIACIFKSSSKKNARLTTADKSMRRSKPQQMEIAATMPNSLDRETFSSVSGFGIV